MSSHKAHVYRVINPHVFDQPGIPENHMCEIRTNGPYVLIYWDNGWHEFLNGYNFEYQAVRDGEYLVGEGNVVIHDNWKDQKETAGESVDAD